MSKAGKSEKRRVPSWETNDAYIEHAHRVASRSPKRVFVGTCSRVTSPLDRQLTSIQYPLLQYVSSCTYIHLIHMKIAMNQTDGPQDPFFFIASSSSRCSSASICAPLEGLFPCLRAGSSGSVTVFLLSSSSDSTLSFCSCSNLLFNRRLSLQSHSVAPSAYART